MTLNLNILFIFCSIGCIISSDNKDFSFIHIFCNSSAKCILELKNSSNFYFTSQNTQISLENHLNLSQNLTLEGLGLNNSLLIQDSSIRISDNYFIKIINIHIKIQSYVESHSIILLLNKASLMIKVKKIITKNLF